MKGKVSRNTRKYSKNNKKQNNPIKAVVMFAFAVLLMCLILIKGENIWFYIHNFIFSLFGPSCILWPILIGVFAVFDSCGKNTKEVRLKYIISSVLVVLCSAAFYVFTFKIPHGFSGNLFGYIFSECTKGNLNGNSGFIGAVIGQPFVWAFGSMGAKISLIIIMFVGFMFVSGRTLMEFFGVFSKPAKVIKEKIEDKNLEYKNRRNAKIDIDIGEEKISSRKEEFLNEDEEISKVTEKFLSEVEKKHKYGDLSKEKVEESEFKIPKFSNDKDKEYEFPPISLLKSSVSPRSGDITSELNNNGKILVETLKSFNVQTKIIDISRGPAVTRYELQPAAGVKISKITNLADDIALNLAAPGVRIEAPIPGKAAVGIEIPNKVVSVVTMKELINSYNFKHVKSKLTVVLGEDISGNIMLADLAKMPHLLIAGSTGSGKSVCINSFIISLLYNARPDEVKLVMIDPKVVELGIYNGIPHLLVPVVTDARKAAGALNWAVKEMLLRYKKFAENNVRDLESYNKLIENNPCLTDKEGEVLEKMPQIVIIIDELSDLMMAAPNEVEDYICRLAQMARAAGMHLVIATQRPSVDVITGIIKANIPSRVAFAVSSQIDSRTILDMSGAEKLLGRGDMLFYPVGSPKPIRVQGCYVTDKEIEKVTEFLKSSSEVSYDNKVAEEIEKNTLPEGGKQEKQSADGSNMDPVMKEAVKCVVEAGQASTSMLQRKLRVGYARAGRLIDEMEQMGIVGPHEGSKPRQVLMNYQQFLEMSMNQGE